MRVLNKTSIGAPARPIKPLRYGRPYRPFAPEATHPANDNGPHVPGPIERTVLWLVPLMAFGLLALAVIVGT
jgi:hypothetical protein